MEEEENKTCEINNKLLLFWFFNIVIQLKIKNTSELLKAERKP